MRLKTVLSIVTGLVLVTPAFADLQDWEFNVNGTDYYPANGNSLSSIPGLNSSSFNSTTGLGTLQLVFNPGSAGTYYVGAWFFDPASTPFYNEYGVQNGSAASGQTWQIDIPEYDVTSKNHGTGTILDNLAAGTLNDTNTVPGTTTNYLDNCGANGGGSATASCNDIVSMALGLKFTLASNQEEIITLTLGTSNPGGFSVEDVHPVDGSNPNAADIFLSETFTTQPTGTKPPPTVPEPAPWSLFGLAGAILAFGIRRRKTSVN